MYDVQLNSSHNSWLKKAEESVAREDVATLRTKYDTGRDFSPLKHWSHPVLSPSSHLLQLLLSSYVSMTRTRSSENWHASRTTRSILRMKLLKLASIRFAFRAIEYASERRRTTEQVAEDCQLQTATKSQVGRRHMRTRLWTTKKVLEGIPHSLSELASRH